ncbi:MAG: phosphotransferase [Planctomycetes bacterium]|nr:phosphotransferase [Planctomycetota bacterium]
MPPEDPPNVGSPPAGRLVGGDRNATKARVYVEERDGRRVAVKTSVGAGFVARWLLRRESRIFAALPPLGCVPSVLETRPDRVVTAWVDGTELFDLRLDGFTEAQAAALEAAIAELHAAGFAHGDLGRHDVIFRPDGGVTFIDFATAVGPACPRLLWRVLLPFWKRTDRGRVARLVERYRKIHRERNARRAATRVR